MSGPRELLDGYLATRRALGFKLTRAEGPLFPTSTGTSLTKAAVGKIVACYTATAASAAPVSCAG